MSGFMVVKLTSTPAGRAAKVLGKRGAPVWVGLRLMLTWLLGVSSVVLLLDR